MSKLEDHLKENSTLKEIIRFSEYDFRVEYIDYFNQRLKNAKRSVEEMNFSADDLLSGDDCRKFITYKILTKNSKFDADNSFGTCELMGEIYNKLWGTTIRYSNFMSIEAFLIDDNRVLLFGGDVYNSVLASTGFPSNKKAIDYYIEDPEQFNSLISEKGLCEMIKVSHVLGNFGLVPAYFNGYRGRDRRIKDFIDKSLVELNKSGFNYLNILIKNNRGIKKKQNRESFEKQLREKYREFQPNDFVKYVNIMFLWDLVAGEIATKEDCEIIVYNVSEDHKIWTKLIPKIIRRRSLFMAMMVYFSTKNNTTYKEIIKDIATVEKILGYEEVFNILIQKLPEEDRGVIEEIKRKILAIQLRINRE